MHCYYEMPLYGILMNLIIIPCMPVLQGLALIETVLGGAAAIPAILLTRDLHMILTAASKPPLTTVILGNPGGAQTVLYIGIFILFLFFSERARTNTGQK